MSERPPKIPRKMPEEHQKFGATPFYVLDTTTLSSLKEHREAFDKIVRESDPSTPRGRERIAAATVAYEAIEKWREPKEAKALTRLSKKKRAIEDASDRAFAQSFTHNQEEDPQSLPGLQAQGGAEPEERPREVSPSIAIEGEKDADSPQESASSPQREPEVAFGAEESLLVGYENHEDLSRVLFDASQEPVRAQTTTEEQVFESAEHHEKLGDIVFAHTPQTEPSVPQEQVASRAKTPENVSNVPSESTPPAQEHPPTTESKEKEYWTTPSKSTHTTNEASKVHASSHGGGHHGGFSARGFGKTVARGVFGGAGALLLLFFLKGLEWGRAVRDGILGALGFGGKKKEKPAGAKAKPAPAHDHH